MDRYQIIETATGRKLNVILWDGVTPLDPGDGFHIEPDDGQPMWEAPAEPASPPERVTNFQARYVMRQVPMPDGRSLFTAVDGDLRAAVEAVSALGEFDPLRIEADLNWQAWEQANEYERNGAITRLLAARYGFEDERTDELFRQASTVVV
jgi:hypothetical protein